LLCLQTSGQNRILIDKTPLISSASHFNFEVGALFGGATPTKAPSGDGTEFWAPCIARP